MSQPEATGAGDYAWDNSWADAGRRLELLEQCWDPGTHRALQAAGIRPGWRCLEVGGGGGSVVKWLCGQVGPDGNVVTVDLDTRFLETIDAPNLEVIKGDIVADGVPEGEFDLVHTRLVLMHIPVRDRLIPELASRLAPGGTLVLEEADFFSMAASESKDYREFVLSMAEILLGTAGMHPVWGRTLGRRLVDCGLTDVTFSAPVKIFQGGSPEAEFFRITYIQAGDLLLSHGLDKELYNEGLRLLEDDTVWLPAPAIATVTGRRPA